MPICLQTMAFPHFSQLCFQTYLPCNLVSAMIAIKVVVRRFSVQDNALWTTSNLQQPLTSYRIHTFPCRPVVARPLPAGL